MLPEQVDVLVVGAGPAGLAAALALKRLGVERVTVVDREAEAGGMPRLCHHTGFGLRDLHRLFSGPAYAQQYRTLVQAAQVDVHTYTTMTHWCSPNRLAFTSPQGLGEVTARAILLATGCRERPRSALLAPGKRLHGVLTTGSLQRFVYQEQLPVGRRAVIVGAELVSLSALLTLRHAGVTPVCLTTELPRHQIYFPYLPMKWLLTDLLLRTPIRTRIRLTQILGEERVIAVELTQLDSGHVETVPCDTVIFTGNWIPEHEAARTGSLLLDPGTRGPQVDGGWHTSQPGVFAAGNLVRGAETADWCALEGRQAARHIHHYLQSRQWPAPGVPIQALPPLAWVYPNRISNNTLIETKHLYFRSQEFRRRVQIQVYQGKRLLHSEYFQQLIVNETMRLSGGWMKQVEVDGEEVRIGISSRQ